MYYRMYISLFYRTVSFFFPLFFTYVQSARGVHNRGGRILARAEGPAHAHIEDKSGG